jgi:hypothetical protein
MSGLISYLIIGDRCRYWCTLDALLLLAMRIVLDFYVGHLCKRTVNSL